MAIIPTVIKILFILSIQRAARCFFLGIIITKKAGCPFVGTACFFVQSLCELFGCLPQLTIWSVFVILIIF